MERAPDSTPPSLDDICKRLERIEDKLDPENEHYALKPVLPYIQASAGLGILYRFLIAIGSLAIAYSAFGDLVHKYLFNNG